MFSLRECRLFLTGTLLFPLVLGSQPSLDSAATQASLARAAEAKGDFGEAVRIYAALTRSFPNSAELYSNLGVAYSFDKKPQQALEALKKALALKPDLVPALLFTGISLYQLSEPAQATVYLDKVVSIAPVDVLARTWLGYAAMAAGRPEKAIPNLTFASEKDPANQDVLYALGNCNLMLATEETRKLAAAAPDGARLWQLAAQQYAARGDMDHAVAFFREALARKPDDPDIQNDLNDALAKGGKDPGIARRDASAPDPAGSEQHYAQARQYAAGARAAFERIAHVAPDSYRAHQVLADSIAAGGQPTDAEVDELKTVLRLKPALPGINSRIGVIRLSQARLPEALQAFDAELRIQPNSAWAHFGRARVLSAMGDDQNAEAELKKTVTLEDPPAESRYELAKILNRRGDLAAAARLLEEYTALRRDDASAHYLLSRVYRDLSRTPESGRELALFRKYSQNERRHSEAMKAMSRFVQQSEAASRTGALAAP